MQKQQHDDQFRIGADRHAGSLSSAALAHAAPLAFGVLLLLLILRSLVTPAPILASDEYAYNILSRYLYQDELFAYDGMLQQIANPLYLALQHGWILIGGGNGVLVTRLVHICEWFGIGAILYATFAPLIGRRAAGFGAAAMLLLPTSFYTLTAMPETDLALLAALTGHVAIRWLPVAPLRAAVAIGALSGTALLFKPHAIAWVPALLALFAGTGFLYQRDKGYAAIITALLLYIFSWYAALLFGWRLCFGSWEFNPSAALGLKFYGSHMHIAGNKGFWSGNAVQIVRYLVAHTLVIAMLFLPAVAAMLAICWQALANRNDRPQAGLFAAAAFVLLMLASHLAMVGYFSASAGARNVDEAMRLHGRYLGSVLVLLPFFYFAFLQNARMRAIRLMALAGLLVCVPFHLWLERVFKLYPWDYPELYAFFSFPNHYYWGFDGPNAIGRLAFGICVLGFVATCIRPALFRVAMTLQLVLLLLIGHVQIQRWLNVHMQLNGDNIDMSMALGKALRPAQPGDGLLIGDQRYGSMSHILFNLGSAPRVLVKERGTSITASDVKDAKWVVTAAEYDVKFPHRSLIRFGALTLYPLRTVNPVVITPEKHDWNGAPFVIQFGSIEGAVTTLQGFNAPEEWGAWTSQSTAMVELAEFIEGDIVVEFFGWTIPENLGNDLRITIGDGVATHTFNR